MDRRRFFGSVGSFVGAATLLGCRGKQVGEVLKDDKKDLVGSHAAGAETYKPLIDESLGKLLDRQCATLQPAAAPTEASAPAIGVVPTTQSCEVGRCGST